MAGLVSSRDVVDRGPHPVVRDPLDGESLRFKEDKTNRHRFTKNENAKANTSRPDSLSNPDLVPLTEPEVRRLLVHIVWPKLTNIERALMWSTWRRRHQAIAKPCHYRTRTRKQNAQL